MKISPLAYQEMIEGFLEKHLNSKVKITAEKPLHGGSINKVYLLSVMTPSHNDIPTKWVVKINTGRPAGFLKKEWEGLEYLSQAVTEHKIPIRVPHPIGTIVPPNSPSVQILIMEYIPMGSPQSSESWREFGYQLALLHKKTGESRKVKGVKQQYGWQEDTFIGNSVQHNTLEADWITFFQKYRLIPQRKWAVDNQLLPISQTQKLDRLIETLAHYLPPRPLGSLLHGDLWSGNSFFSDHGKPVIFDPAVYYGHGETDLAMTKLFGSFPTSFYQGYQVLFPPDETSEIRENIYNLYHLLNHLNLFGSSYLSSVSSTLDYIIQHG